MAKKTKKPTRRPAEARKTVEGTPGRFAASAFPLESYDDILKAIAYIERQYVSEPVPVGRGMTSSGIAVMREFLQRAEQWCLNHRPESYVPVIQGQPCGLMGEGISCGWYVVCPFRDGRRKPLLHSPERSQLVLFPGFEQAADLAAAMNLGRLSRQGIQL